MLLQQFAFCLLYFILSATTTTTTTKYQSYNCIFKFKMFPTDARSFSLSDVNSFIISFAAVGQKYKLFYFSLCAHIYTNTCYKTYDNQTHKTKKGRTNNRNERI